jgi:lysophospholipase L1-like esterase
MSRLILAAVLLAAPFVSAQPAPAATYVALGSSFAAGPGIPKPDPASSARCARSTENYAHLFAAERGLTLRDVSCSGATTADVLQGNHALPPQLDAVTPAARLVTVTVGGNDVFFIGSLYGWSCANAPARAAGFWQRVCSVKTPEEVETAFASLDEHLRAIVTAVHQRAPAARVIFVDYVTVVPATGSCPERLPLTAAQLDVARTIAARLAAATEKAASATGAEVLKASLLSAAHDVCSPDPWVTGFTFPQDPGSFQPIAYHPNQKAMQAVAAKLQQLFP